MDGYHRKPNDIRGLSLSPMEEKILLLRAEGKRLAEIAEELGRGLSTVNTHLRRAMEKLQARNSTHAVFKLIDRTGNDAEA